MRFPALLFSVLLFTACSDQKPVGSPIDIHAVTTEAGIVSGISGTDSVVMIFKGVPFAAPPVKDLRWKAPAPPVPWEGIRKCDDFPPSALQAKPAPFAMWSMEFMAPEKPLSEDCLYLNIWSAAKTSDDKLPVMVWIHGGAFTSGSGSVPLYDGEEIAKKGVVFITINYRLGIFGFLAHPELSAESPDHVSGNYGILDQIAALRWIRDNVAAFGGNPDNVTIAGQSAGAFSVHALVVSPRAKGLFHRAIAQSGGMFRGINSGSDLKTAEKAGLELASSLKAPSLATLRNLPADDLLKAGGSWGVIVDSLIILPAYKTFKDSAHNDVPLITGWNADEFFFAQPLKAKQYKTDAYHNFGKLADEYLNAFPASTDEEAVASQKLFTVLNFGWQNYTWARLQSQTGKSPSYLYYFSHVPPGLPDYGAFHSAEFGYALKSLKHWDRPFVPSDYQLAEMMSSYWVNFAKNGNPNGSGLPEWSPFNIDNEKAMEFGDEVRLIDVPHKQQLIFLDHYRLQDN